MSPRSNMATSCTGGLRHPRKPVVFLALSLLTEPYIRPKLKLPHISINFLG